MSVKVLKITTLQGHKIEVSADSYGYGEFEFKIQDDEITYCWLSRNDAHLLMLYLQEHLK